MSERTPLIDLHAHLPMQLKLPRRPCDTAKQTKRNQRLMTVANRLFNFRSIFHPRFRIEDARDEAVSFGSVLYLPSDELFGPCGAFTNLESQLGKATETLTSAGYHVARNGAELYETIDGGKLAAFHCLEGGFSVEEAAQVTRLRALGIAYVVLAHLLPRGIAPCVNAFPFFTDAEFERMFPMPDKLEARGREICDALCQHGIIPDITHMTLQAVHEVFEIAQKHKCPVIVSHGAPQHGGRDEYKLNLCPDVIKAIHNSGGVIGVIFYDHWLKPPGSRETATIDAVIEAMKTIERVTGTTDCIAIGSDFDGFIRPVRGLESVGKIRALERRLNGLFSAEQVKGILWKNAARTLRAGWK